MNGPQLHIPEPQPDSLESLPVHFNRIPEWLESLPIANTEESATQLVTLLSRLNRYPLGSSERETILNSCKPVTETLIAGLRKPLFRTAYPLGKKPKKAACSTYITFFLVRGMLIKEPNNVATRMKMAVSGDIPSRSKENASRFRKITRNKRGKARMKRSATRHPTGR